MVYKFEDLVIWQLARKLISQIYATMRDNRDYGFKDQIERAAVSIMNNIAEGFSKHKFTKDNKMFANYLTIAYGSCGEVKSMLYIAEDLGYITQEAGKQLRDDCKSIEMKIEALQTALHNPS